MTAGTTHEPTKAPITSATQQGGAGSVTLEKSGVPDLAEFKGAAAVGGTDLKGISTDQVSLADGTTLQFHNFGNKLESLIISENPKIIVAAGHLNVGSLKFEGPDSQLDLVMAGQHSKVDFGPKTPSSSGKIKVIVPASIINGTIVKGPEILLEGDLPGGFMSIHHNTPSMFPHPLPEGHAQPKSNIQVHIPGLMPLSSESLAHVRFTGGKAIFEIDLPNAVTEEAPVEATALGDHSDHHAVGLSGE